MISIVPYYKKERKAVIIRVILKSQVAKVIQTGVKVEPSQWKDGKVTAHPNKSILNQKIQNKVHELQALITKAELMGVPLTKDRIKRLAEGGEITTDFYKHCKQWIEEKYKNKGTKSAALSDLKKVHTYASSLQFGDIDARWLSRYENYVRIDLGLKGNTPWKCMKFVRTMIYDAQKVLGRHLPNPFETKEYKMPPYIDPNKDGLTLKEVDELEKLIKKDIPVMYKIVTAKFLFMCYSGLRISDAKRFSKEHLINGRIVMTSQKTGAAINMKIWNRLENILKVLNELPDKKFADQNLNEWLKIIADMAEIKRIILTTHVGRHTLGYLLAEMNIPIEVAQQIMGHKRKKTTEGYYHLHLTNIDRHIDRLNDL